ncbi:MAG: 4Fe-4S binding protein [Heliobacteriaceae bacterium]|nr:4Fe-4S binding protein [Heliobacteriaceae bacterium]
MSIILPAILGGALILAGLVWLRLERRFFPHPSTVAFWRLSDLPLIQKAAGYVYAARTAWYLKPASRPRLTRLFRRYETGDTYHGKLVTREDAAKIITLNQPVVLTGLEHVIPYPVARDIILQAPLPRITVMECPCRAQKKQPCRPTDVCLVIGEPFASFVLDHQPGRAKKITAAAALAILEAEELRGHIHTAWFKDVMHHRFYAICNCCLCCCLGMQSYSRGVNRLAHSGYRPVIRPENCTACGRCVQVCPFNAGQMDGKTPVIKEDICLGCGLCVSHCPQAAIKLSPAPEKGIPLDLEKLNHR